MFQKARFILGVVCGNRLMNLDDYILLKFNSGFYALTKKKLDETADIDNNALISISITTIA